MYSNTSWEIPSNSIAELFVSMIYSSFLFSTYEIQLDQLLVLSREDYLHLHSLKIIL